MQLLTTVQMIILIRHAQSEGNKNRDIHQFIPDHRVKLTQHGWTQVCLDLCPPRTRQVLTDIVSRTGRRGRPNPPIPVEARRYSAVLHLTLSSNTRDHRRHPTHTHVRRPHTFSIPPQYHHRLRRTPTTRARLWQLPAMLGGNGEDVARAG